jgi:hypothetical protein
MKMQSLKRLRVEALKRKSSAHESAIFTLQCFNALTNGIHAF